MKDMDDRDGNRQSAGANQVILNEAKQGLLKSPIGFASGLEGPEIVPEKVMHHRGFSAQDLAPFDGPIRKNLRECPESEHIDKNAQPTDETKLNELLCD